MTGRAITGREAERIGLANRAVAEDELDGAVQELVDELLACQPVPVGLAKRVLDGVARPTLALNLEHEVTAQQACVWSDEFRALLAAAAGSRA